MKVVSMLKDLGAVSSLTLWKKEDVLSLKTVFQFVVSYDKIIHLTYLNGLVVAKMYFPAT